MPLRGPLSDAALRAALTSSLVVGCFHLKDAIGQGGIEEGNTDGKAVELALELGIDFHDGSGTTGRGGT